MNDVAKTETNGKPVNLSAGISVALEEPVQAHGEEMKTIVFRKPTGADIIGMGEEYPVVVDWKNGGFPQMAPAPMAKMMATLAAVPPSTIAKMGAKDFATCAFRLFPFFTPGPQAQE